MEISMKRFKITDLLIGIIFTLLFISIAVVITINFRPLYYMDIKLLNIETSSGIAKSDILKNYNALIDYSSPFFKGGLKFPTLAASASGLKHFAEVKTLFTAFYIMGAITLILGILIFIYKSRNREYSYLLASSITAIVLPLLLGILMAVNFERTFIIFHKIFFNNNDWLFDPVTDPIITILPEDFFMHCAILIILIVILLSAVFLILYFTKRKHYGIRYRRSRELKF
jgi:integral membrane protein (TIGR01906 family)